MGQVGSILLVQKMMRRPWGRIRRLQTTQIRNRESAGGVEMHAPEVNVVRTGLFPSGMMPLFRNATPETDLEYAALGGPISVAVRDSQPVERRARLGRDATFCRKDTPSCTSRAPVDRGGAPRTELLNRQSTGVGNSPNTAMLLSPGKSIGVEGT